MKNTLDHALVVHVWHIDTLDELAEAATHLPIDAAQFVTLPEDFEPEQRNMVAAAFPRAHLILVENRGQDIGALFQLMEQVDLSLYAFICKIHTKKGPNMPDEWRRALLDGVLGSQRQVSHIIERFRADPQVMLAGARQLFVHGPTYLDKNADVMKTSFDDIIGDFDLAADQWGFIAGTCFWIRTQILFDLAKHVPEFKSADYVTDGAPAHAVERMFGLAVAIRQGTMLLQDLRFPDRKPREEQGFPPDMPRRKLRMAQILTPLAANMFIRPRYVKAPLPPLQARNRVAVFASYSGDGMLPPQVIPYLKGLKSLTSAIVVVCDNDLAASEIEKLSGLANHVITGRHGEYDFGSYKRGVEWLRQARHLENADDLILCNDSCYGPVGSFEPMFAEMEARNVDFWGATDSHEFKYHLQSFFVVLSRAAFNSAAFVQFIDGVEKQDSVQDVIMKYELGLTQALLDAGFELASMISNKFMGMGKKDPAYNNITLLPIYTLHKGLPLVKAKAMVKPSTNLHGAEAILSYIGNKDKDLFDCLSSDFNVMKFNDSSSIKFSVVMPTYNRSRCITRAIDGFLAQTHENFELIIVDDGSTDGTENIIRNTYSDELIDKRIIYIRLHDNVGVCRARNIGLSYAGGEWIAYADTDNEVRPYFLSMMAHGIKNEPEKDSLYGRMMNVIGGTVVGRPFGQKSIADGNFIDLGVFVHRRTLVNRFGGFDDLLKRLVDWDLCIRYTRHKDPAFVNMVVMDYTDEDLPDRISVRESYLKADTQVRRKHSPAPTVSTVIVSYNHQDFIVEAIESVLAQEGGFHHEILLSDDGSTDATPRIFKHYADKYPNRIRNISRGKNYGISDNYRHCFNEAQGEFLAVLEGDDYWTDPRKLIKQASFLRAHDDAAMVMSRIELLEMDTGHRRLLKRQDRLPDMLSGADFAADGNLNLIVNFSSTMFRSDVVKNLPEGVFEPRLSEITLAFYIDQIGWIGFLPEVMSIYRLNEQSVWTGASMENKHRQAIAIRRSALRLARKIYQPIIQKHIDAREKSLEIELLRSANAS